ncbi:uncharacterized protein JCM6883_001277 [Sporobolomyces salmoneus]|uniref:uncharacterized protein n=1 Tax=Sporobolomyces salmoneus TaxID=183962 RepID=UPI0031779CDA
MVPSPQLETISTNEKFEQGHETVQPRGGNDGEVLADLGYTQGTYELSPFACQALKRGFSVIENFGISFSIISIITGITTQFAFGLSNGGPGVMSIGWIIVSFFTMTVALAMAEIVSAVPTSGGPYHVGFSNLQLLYLGADDVHCLRPGITFGNSILISTLGSVHGFSVTSARQVGISAGLLVFGGIVNTFGIRFLALLNRISIALHSVGVFAIVVALLVKAPTHRTAKEVFATFNDESGWSERASPAYVALTGILVAQYVLTGFDASAHLSEETEHAAKNAPIGVLISVLASAIFGFFVMVSFLFCIQPSDSESTVGQPVLQIFIDAFGVKGATAAFSIVIVCVVLCGTFSITSNSRMYFACARDSLIPKAFSVVNERFASPVRAVWLAVVLALILILPALGSTVAFAAVTAIATSGLYLSYALPVAFRLLENERFLSIRGPFYLGRFSRPISWICVTYVVFITIIFCLPTVTPVDSQTLNYTPIALGIVFAYILISWFAFARRTFHGPRADALKEAARALGGEGANTVNRLEREVTTDSAMKKKEGSDTRVREVDTVEGGGDYK